MHHAALDRPRPHDGHLYHQVVILARPQPGQHAHLRARLDLEHADGVGVADHVVGRIVAWWDVLQPQRRAATLAGQLQRAAQRRQHAQRQHVDLQQQARPGRPCPTAPRCGRAWRRSRSAPGASLPREITKPPGCCDRWRGKPISVCASQAHCRATRESGSSPQAPSVRSISFLPSHHWCARATASITPLSTPSARPVSRSTLRGR